MKRVVPLFLLVLFLTSGCESFFYPSREKYQNLRGVVRRNDGTLAAGVAVKVYPRPGWRGVPIAPALQAFSPICTVETNERGEFTGVLADYFAYTIVAADGAKRVSRPITRKDVTSVEPLVLILP